MELGRDSDTGGQVTIVSGHVFLCLIPGFSLIVIKKIPVLLDMIF